MSVAVRVMSALSIGLLALALLPSCREKLSVATVPHRLVGVWTDVDDHAERPPNSPEEWKAALEGNEPTYMQFLFLQDGTFVLGGLMLGHEFTEEGRWEVVEENPDQLLLRWTSANGTIEDSVIHFVDADVIRKGPDQESGLEILLRRAPGLGPFPGLAKYEDRL